MRAGAAVIVERTIRDKRVRAQCAIGSRLLATDVLDVFELVAAKGAPPEPGVQIRFGWSLLRLFEDDGALRVFEPEYARWPEESWVASIDETLDVVAAQKRLLRRLDIDGDDAAFDQRLCAAPGAIRSQRVFLRRLPSIGRADSGWVVGATNDPEALLRDDELEGYWVSSLVTTRPALLRAMALPTGSIALFSGDSLVEIVDPSGRSHACATRVAAP